MSIRDQLGVGIAAWNYLICSVGSQAILTVSCSLKIEWIMNGLFYCTEKISEFCFVLQECTICCICCEIVTASKWVWKKKEHMKHLHNQVYLDSAVRKLNRTNSYMLKITITANVMPQKLLNQFQRSLIWLRQSVLFTRKCNGSKSRDEFPCGKVA